MSDTRNNFDKTVSGYLEPFNNEYIKAAVALFLILYAGIIAPKLPTHVLKFFDNFLVKIVVFFAIVWVSKKDPTVAIIASIAVLVTLMIANNQLTLQNVSDQVKKESFCGCGMTKEMENKPLRESSHKPSSHKPADLREINGWYNDEEGSDENEIYNENGYSDKEEVYNDLFNRTGKTDTDPNHPDHESLNTNIVTPSPTATVTTIPTLTRLPLMDPEHPDHMHRMPTNVPLATNGGKIIVEPVHPDHQTTVNKKEHPILNGYVEPALSQHADSLDDMIVGYDDHAESDSHHTV